MKRNLRQLFAAPGLALALLGGVHATTVNVDGVGDGDGLNGDEFDTLTAAINSFGALGTDGSPDVINIVVETPIVETAGFLINGTLAAAGGYNSFTDNLTINGDGDADSLDGVLVLTAEEPTGGGVNNARWLIEARPAGVYVIQDLAIIPAFQGAGAQNTGLSCSIAIDEADAATGYTGMTTTFLRCVFSASTTGNAVVPPASAPPADITRFSGDGGQLANSHLTWASGPTTIASTATLNITDCEFGHWTSHVAGSNRYAITSGVDGAIGANLVVNISGCTFANPVNGLGVTNAVGTVNSQQVVVNFSNSTITGMGQHGLAASTAVTGFQTFWNIGPNVTITGNSARGITATSGGASSTGQNILALNGTQAQPVTVVNCGNRGIRTELANATATAPRITNFDEVIVTDCGVYGLEFNEFDFQFGVTVDDSLFARNGSAIAPLGGNVTVRDTNTAAGTGAFNRCTFYRAGRTTATDASDHFSIGFSASDLLTFTFTDCIFAGDTGDLAIHLVDGQTNTINLNNCALVASGPDAIRPTPTLIEAAATGCVINETGTVTANPIFISTGTNPVNASSFDVGANAYAGAGSVGQPNLSGWGDYIGGDVPVELSTFGAL